MPQGRAHRYIHLIDLQGQVSTGQTQIKNRVQLTCNIFKITTRAQGQTRAVKLDSTQGDMTGMLCSNMTQPQTSSIQVQDHQAKSVQHA